MTRLVTLRTKPVEDPGKWCLSRYAIHCPHWWHAMRRCQLGHQPEHISPDGYRRPQSCIDSAEEHHEKA